MQQFVRNEMMLGVEAQKQLFNSHVAVFGLGGVGSYTVEALARAGVGAFTLVDFDQVELSNINRQLFALHSTVGQNKVDVAKQRIADINPNARVNALLRRFSAENATDIDFSVFDYVVDAVDTVTSKLLLAEICNRTGTPIVSSMGTGNKLNPLAFKVADITETSVCPLAKVMRRELKKRGIEHLKVVYSDEQPIKAQVLYDQPQDSRIAPASISFVPSVAGLILAGVVIKDLLHLN